MSRHFSFPLLWAILFAAAACLVLPYAGIQNDEALFGGGIYEQWGMADTLTLGKRQIPLMLMAYLGALKSWLWTPILHLFKPTVWSVRLPAILAGAATLLLLARFLRRASSATTAAIAGALLATEPTNLLTTTFDWGPVALQHLFGVAGLAALIAFSQNLKTYYLVLGFGAFGLALWDKALFAWFLSGVSLAALLVFPREIWRLVTPIRIAIAIVSFLIGSFPLWLYNIRQPWATFRGTAGFSLENASGKALVLKAALAGGSLFGYLPRESAEPAQQRAPQGPLERVSVWLDEKTGSQRATYNAEAVAIALLLIPWLWFTPSRRLIVWCVVAAGIAWIQMAATNNAGGSAHHCVLLWPLPQIVVAAALGEIARRGRFGLAATLLLTSGLFVSNTLVLNRHLTMFVRNGPTTVWSDALLTLSNTLGRIPAAEIYINDWGLLDSLRLLHRGRLPLRLGSDPISKPELTAEDRKTVTDRLRPDVLFVSFTDGNQVFAGVNQKMRELAESAGFRRETVTIVSDRHGRALIEVFRYLKA